MKGKTGKLIAVIGLMAILLTGCGKIDSPEKVSSKNLEQAKEEMIGLSQMEVNDIWKEPDSWNEEDRTAVWYTKEDSSYVILYFDEAFHVCDVFYDTFT